MIRTPKSLWLLFFAAIFIVIVTGCNDQLRQFITPVPGPSGDPGLLSHAIVLSTNPAVPTNGTTALGSDLHIDVSGDSVVGVVPVGSKPVFLGKTSSRVFVLNSDTPPTVTTYLGLLPLNSSISTITLPAGVTAQAGGTSNTGNFYATNGPGSNVSLIASSALAFSGSFSVGTNPVAVAGNSNSNKIYVVNQGSGTVSAVSTIDNFTVATIPVGTSPIWGVMAPDGVHVFIVNQGSNTVSVIDTFLDQVIATIPVGASPNYAVFEPHLQRLYVSNTGSATISVIKANGIDLANQILPTKIADIPIPAAATSLAALADGSRAYAAIGGCPTGTNHINLLPTNLASCNGNQVAVIDAQALALKKVIPVGAGAVSIDAANDSSRVYVVGANAGNISIIRTSDDTVLTTIPAPQQSLGCQSPIFCPANATQIPFMVRVFP
jgi:YVTN family beta-propeller protein